jgi:hypothetical protein
VRKIFRERYELRERAINWWGGEKLYVGAKVVATLPTLNTPREVTARDTWFKRNPIPHLQPAHH